MEGVSSQVSLHRLILQVASLKVSLPPHMLTISSGAIPLSVGELTFQDGRVYEGVFSTAGKPHGFGSEMRPDGDRYYGMWRKGRRHGLGVRTWPEGQVYCGEWSSGKMHGFGVFTWPSGLQYFGKWAEHKRHGVGVEMHNDASAQHFYCGEWKRGKRDGFGKRCKQHSGQLWAGAFRAGRRDRTAAHDSAEEAKGNQLALLPLTWLVRLWMLVWRTCFNRVITIRCLDDIDVTDHSESVTERIRSTLQHMLAMLSSPLCRMNVRSLLEAASSLRRRERSAFDSGNSNQMEWTTALSVWTKEIAKLFGQTLRSARKAEQRNMQANAGMKDALARVKRRITGDVAMKVETKSAKDSEGSG